MGVVVFALIPQFLKLFIIACAVSIQGSKGYAISPSLAFSTFVHTREETRGPISHRQSWGSTAPSSPLDRDGFVISPSAAPLPVDPLPREAPTLLPPRDPWRTIAPISPVVPNVTLLPPSSAPTPQKIKVFEPSVSPSPSPSTITLSPPYMAAPVPSAAQQNAPPPSKQLSPPQSEAPAVRPPVSTPTASAPAAIPSDNWPKNSPVPPPIEHGSFPPKVDKRNASKSHTPVPVSPVTLLPPISAPTPQKIKGTEPSISPSSSQSTVTLSPPFKAAPLPSNAQGNARPSSIQPSPPQTKAPVVRPPVSTPNAPAPAAIPFGNLPKNSPVSQPIEHGSFPPKVDKRNASKSHNPDPGLAVTLPPPTSDPIPPKTKRIEPSISPSPSAITRSPPYEAAPIPSTAQRNAPPPSIQLSPPQRKIPLVSPPVSTPNALASVALPSGTSPKNSPISPPIEPGSSPPMVDNRNTSNSYTPEPTSPAPAILPSTPKVSPVSQPIHIGSFPPSVHREGENKSHTAEPIAPAPVAVNVPNSPMSQPSENGSSPLTAHKGNSSTGPTLDPISQAPVALSPAILPETSPISQPIHHGNFPPNVQNRTTNKDPTHIPEPAPSHSLASPPWKMENNQPIGHPIFPKIAPSMLHVPGTSPTRAFPINPPVFHPVTRGVSPSKLPAPVVSSTLTPSGSFNRKEGGEPVSAPFYSKPKPSKPLAVINSSAQAPLASPALTPSRSINWQDGGEPVPAPLYRTPKPLPAVVHSASPAQAPAAHNSRQFHDAPEPLILSPKSPFNKENHSPASSPLTTLHKNHHARNMITSPTPASSYLVSPPTSKPQDQQTPPLLPPTSRQRHTAPPPMTTDSSVTPFAFPIMSPASQVSPAPSPSFVISTHPTKILFHPPKVSPSMSPKKPIVPRVQALPPPPPNEDCLSTICSEPYANSPPGAPCRCVLPMKVGLRLSVSLYTFFPLVSELASEIATGVFMRQSQVRIMGANTASQDQDKTDALVYLVPLGEDFDSATSLLTSERFWHKQVAIKASSFGDYEVLYVIYPGLPPSPPMPPSSISMIDGGPYSNNGNNGRMIKPIGVDIPKRQHEGGLSRGIIAIIALSAFLAAVLCFAAVWALFKYRHHHLSQPTPTPRVSPRSITKTQGGSSAAGGVASASSSFRSSIAAYAGSAKTFSVSDIEKATDNFHPSRIIGEGGFGRVYSGIFEDGTKVAVKVLKREDHHGDREFLSEVEMLSRLHHRNLVKLIGICTEVSFRCLVYELIPNGSVESHLHEVDRGNSPLDWSARIKIALGAARGLAYLHEDSSPHVIHRDFKSSNILLEDDYTPKVSDFGLARTASDKENKHISTRVMGTFGYVAPEYAMTGHLLVKSDVYSYGVVLLELLTGRKPVDMSQPPGQENLVAWARPLLTSKEGLLTIIDPSLGTDVPLDSVAKVAAIASMCVQPEVSDRPFMGEVVQALKLVCNECDEAKDAAGSRNYSHEDLSLDLETVSGQPPANFQRQFSAADCASGGDIENGLTASEIFGSSARFGRQASGSFRRHSYSGPLRPGRSRRLWQIIRRLSSGSVSEHGTVFKS